MLKHSQDLTLLLSGLFVTVSTFPSPRPNLNPDKTCGRVDPFFFSFFLICVAASPFSVLDDVPVFVVLVLLVATGPGLGPSPGIELLALLALLAPAAKPTVTLLSACDGLYASRNSFRFDLDSLNLESVALLTLVNAPDSCPLLWNLAWDGDAVGVSSGTMTTDVDGSMLPRKVSLAA